MSVIEFIRYLLPDRLRQGVTETMRAHGYYQEVRPKLAGAAGYKANSASVKFTNKKLDFCQIWLGDHKGPVRLSFIIIDSWFL